jgi:phosphatidylethanolamine-binding protein (PEBP) family uncharacterized protein
VLGQNALGNVGYGGPLGNVGYDGPLGTLGRNIRYRFRLFALDQPLELSPGRDREAFLAAASRHFSSRGT